jgi:uncharacterized protein
VEAPAPFSDDLSKPFWDGARSHRLIIQRCTACRRFVHPPVKNCESCGAASFSYEEVSGRARVIDFSLTVSGARHPYFAERAPYLVGLIELNEQPGLYMLTNFPGSSLDELRIGALAEVLFEEIAPDVVLPQFHLTSRGLGR